MNWSRERHAPTLQAGSRHKARRLAGVRVATNDRPQCKARTRPHLLRRQFQQASRGRPHGNVGGGILRTLPWVDRSLPHERVHPRFRGDHLFSLTVTACPMLNMRTSILRPCVFSPVG